MSACPSHGPLLGGYVLGALEPAEHDEMRRHVVGCPYCGPEQRELGQLPALLDQIESADDPPPSLSPALEEAVLDRFARERRRPRRALPKRLTPRHIAALAGACAAALVLALLVWPTAKEDEGRAYAQATLNPPRATPHTAGMAYAAEVSAGTRVRLRARGLHRGSDAVYELWCVRTDGHWVNGGSFRSGPDGRADVQLTAAVRPGDYHTMVVTRRPHGGPGGSHGREVLRGELEY